LPTSNKEELEGTTYQVYLYAVRSGKPVNTRDVRKGVNLSSPSVAFRHLQKLEALGLLKKNEYGDYTVKEKINISGSVWVGRNLVPRLLMYCLFFAGLLIVEIVIMAIKQSADLNFIYLTVLTAMGVIIFAAEGLLLYFNNRTKQRQ
jgi:hypothetical protein